MYNSINVEEALSYVCGRYAHKVPPSELDSCKNKFLQKFLPGILTTLDSYQSEDDGSPEELLEDYLNFSLDKLFLRFLGEENKAYRPAYQQKIEAWIESGESVYDRLKTLLDGDFLDFCEEPENDEMTLEGGCYNHSFEYLEQQSKIRYRRAEVYKQHFPTDRLVTLSDEEISNQLLYHCYADYPNFMDIAMRGVLGEEQARRKQLLLTQC